VKSRKRLACCNAIVFLAITAGLIAQAGAADWTYEGDTGPDHWGSLSKKFSACQEGLMQSPIDISLANAQSTIETSIDYATGPASVINNGHTIQVNFEPGSYLTSSGQVFPLAQVHFHTPSEHTLNGRHFPLVAHFVHQKKSGSIAVLGVMFEEGSHNKALQEIIDVVPSSTTKSSAIKGDQFNPEQLVPKDNLSVLRYMGSLTTPPCSEGVNWHVSKVTLEADNKQIRSLTKLMGNNARPVQPTNNRLIIAPR